MAEFYLRNSQGVSQLSSEKANFILQATEESQLQPLQAQSCLQLPALSQSLCLRRPPQNAQGRFLVGRGGGQPLCSRKGVRACVRKRVHELFCSNRLSDEIFTIKQHFNALTITVSLHYIVKV